MTQFIASWIAANMLDTFIKQIPMIIIACIMTYILCKKFPQYVNCFIIICAIYGLGRGAYFLYTLSPFIAESSFSLVYGLLMFIPYLIVFLGALLVKFIWKKKHTS